MIAYLDVLGIQFQALLLVNKEFLNVFALVTLQLNHLAHLGIIDDGAIARCGKQPNTGQLTCSCQA